MKACPNCQQRKPESEYHRDKRRSGGLAYYCKRCNLTISNEWKQRYPDHVHFLTKQRVRLKGGSKTILENMAADNNSKADFRQAMQSGTSLNEAIEILVMGPVGKAICRFIVRNGCRATLDCLLNAIYGDKPTPDDRSRANNALKLAIHKLKRQMKNTGIAIISLGYGKGYSIVVENGLHKYRKKHADVV